MINHLPEIIISIKWVVAVVALPLLTWWLTKVTGKKKAEVELALDWQKFYNGHIETIKKIHEEEIESIKQLHAKQIEDVKATFKQEIKVLIDKMEEIKTSKEESDRLKQVWENDSFKKSTIIKEKDIIIHDQAEEIDKLKAG